MEAEKDIQIYQDHFSRQLATFGYETQKNLMNMRVFIHGITGLGVQVVKNIIMMGSRSVTLFDPNIVTMNDVGRNFYCNQSQIGKVSRAQACQQKLQKLNGDCEIKVTQDNSIQYITKNFDCIIIIDNYNKNYLTQVNQSCRKNNIGFIVAGCLGLYGYLFNDFGQNHIVKDLTGQEIQTIYINSIQQGQRSIVQCSQRNHHGLETGDIVEFKMTKGMTQINGMRFQIKVISPSCFQIGDTRNFSPYQAQGLAKKVIEPLKLSFKSFQQSLKCFKNSQNQKTSVFNILDQTKQMVLQLTLNQIYQFYEKYSRLPRLLNQQDSQQILQNAKKKYDVLNITKSSQSKQLSLQIVKNISLYAETQISPVCSFFGGIVAQQFVKLTGKYNPINQWLHKEFFDLLPNSNNGKTTRNLMKENNRFNDYIALFGDQFVIECTKLKIFLIGSGSLGCEHLKNLSMMGVSSGQKGKLIVCDKKSVYSNDLPSHFLVTQKDIKKQKVQSVIKNAKQINKDINFEAFMYQIQQKTEQVFNDDFWFDIDLIISAVDNSQSINYIDERCVWYEKPLFYSAVEKLKGSSQVILPHKTSTITDIVGPYQYSFDYSTLLNFPYKLQHLIQWATNFRFVNLFTKFSEQLNKLYLSPKNFIKKIENEAQGQSSNQRFIKRLQKINKLYKTKSQKSFEKCVELMIQQYQQFFIDRIKQIILNFDSIEDQQRRKNFWTGLKRKPQPLEFDIMDPLTLQFIHAGANIYASMLNIPIEENLKLVQGMAQTIYQRRQQYNRLRQRQQNVEQFFLRLMRQLRQFKADQSQAPKVVELDLLNQSNWHLQFVHAATNLRARVYRIEPVDKFKVFIKAAEIIPKVVKTVAVTAGLSVIEIIKFIFKKDTKVHKNSTINLALPLFVFSEPSKPIINWDKQFDPIMMGPIITFPKNFTKWDKIDIKQPMLLCQLMEYFKKHYNVKVSGIVYGKQFVYCQSFYLKTAQRLIMSVQDAISQAVKKKVYKYKRILKIQICGETQQGVDCLFPQVRYFISTKKY